MGRNQHMNCKDARRGRAKLRRFRFSFMEATLSIGVITILAMILMPALETARSVSHRSVCEFNLLAMGMALNAYADDNDVYPFSDHVVADLKKEGYLKIDPDFRCPLDNSRAGDTYTVGFLAGHPQTMRFGDPLVVCGWHARIGSLAVFPDTTVAPLSRISDDDLVPLSITYAGDDVNPGFALNTSDATVIATDDGNEAVLYGNSEAYFISASYDPFGNSGNGLFTVTLGFSDNDGEVNSSSTTNLVFLTTLPKCHVQMTADPSRSSSTLQWDGNKELYIEDTLDYRLSHRVTGQIVEKVVRAAEATYHVKDNEIDEKDFEAQD